MGISNVRIQNILYQYLKETARKELLGLLKVDEKQNHVTYSKMVFSCFSEIHRTQVIFLVQGYTTTLLGSNNSKSNELLAEGLYLIIIALNHNAPNHSTIVIDGNLMELGS